MTWYFCFGIFNISISLLYCFFFQFGMLQRNENEMSSDYDSLLFEEPPEPRCSYLFTTWGIFCSYFTECVFYTFGCIFPFHLWFSTSWPLIMSHRTYMLFSYFSHCCCLSGLVHQSHLEDPNFFPSLHLVDQVRLPIKCLCVIEFFKISDCFL